jgi:hypothetical protein
MGADIYCQFRRIEMRLKSLAVYFCIMVAAAGCGAQIGKTIVETRISEIDQKVDIHFVTPVRCENSTLSYMLLWDSTKPKNKVNMRLVIGREVALSNNKSFDLYVDGVKHSYSPIGDIFVKRGNRLDRDPITNKVYGADNTAVSVVTYEIERTTFDEMITSSKVGLRINFSDNTSLEDVIIDKRDMLKFKKLLDEQAIL